MSKRVNRVSVSTRAVIQRVNRKLAPNRQQLKKCRSSRQRQDVGDYYIIDLQARGLLVSDVNLEELARKLNALEKWETVAAE